MTRAHMLTLYGREYCDLCQQMRRELSALDRALTITWVDIDDDDEIEAKYDTLVPVLVGVDEEIICFYHLDPLALDAYLSKIR